jgi:hypothetical protein
VTIRGIIAAGVLAGALAFVVSMSSCASARTIGYPASDGVPCGWCRSVDAQPGPMWHSSQQFAICKTEPDEGCREYQPQLLSATPGEFFSEVVGPLGVVADKVSIPVPLAP